MNIAKTLWRDRLLPRVVFIPFWIVRVLLVPVGLLARIRGAQSRNLPATLCIEAGVVGWNSIEFKEFYQSACEYLGADRVFKLQIHKNENYIRQVTTAFDHFHPSHYFYDSRSGSPKWILGLLQSTRIALLCGMRGIIPIALLTDFSHRLQRFQTAIVTARRGVVISFLSAKEGAGIFPHQRLVAPSLMPFSKATLALLARLSEERPVPSPFKALFVGSLYEPRTTILRSIQELLKARGFTLEIRGRIAGGPRIPDVEYWSVLSHSRVILTTADQIDWPINDWKWIQQLTYRYLEAMASGTLLIAPEVPGVRRYFVPGEHFVSFTSPAHAAEVIEYYLLNEPERARIAEQGMAHAHALVAARSFWVGVDIGLGRDSLT